MIYYDDYTLLKNVGYDINNSDDLFKLICDNPRNSAKYFDILSLCYSVVDDSEFNKIWIPAETDEDGLYRCLWHYVRKPSLQQL